MAPEVKLRLPRPSEIGPYESNPLELKNFLLDWETINILDELRLSNEVVAVIEGSVTDSEFQTWAFQAKNSLRVHFKREIEMAVSTDESSSDEADQGNRFNLFIRFAPEE